ncbi:MAG: peptidylprolyl isomerase [Planctomycetota bacterium]|jgi:cyclophilin family peptidyl-prolyl cis-trans isomerase
MPDYPKAVISTSQGDMTVELWNDVAPNHVENFLKLGRSGFYDNLKFHRIVPDFVVQGGCPKGDGTGNPGWSVKAEFNDRPHQPGTLSMARSSDPDSGGSQFFICLTRVTEGMDVVEALGNTEVDQATGAPKDPPVLLGVKPIE